MFQSNGYIAVEGQRRVESQTFRRYPGSSRAGCIQTVEITCWRNYFSWIFIISKYGKHLVCRVSEVKKKLVGGVTGQVNFSNRTSVFASDFNGH